jgi:hypothetical protein
MEVLGKNKQNQNKPQNPNTNKKHIKNKLREQPQRKTKKKAKTKFYIPLVFATGDKACGLCCYLPPLLLLHPSSLFGALCWT